MSGKKGGIISAVANATGTTDLRNGTLGYLYDPVGKIAGDQRNARRGVKQEEKRQEGLQAEAEAAVKDKEVVAGETEKQRKKRLAQKAIAGSRAGRSGTILTSPLGDSSGGGDAGPGGKTLLGA